MQQRAPIDEAFAAFERGDVARARAYVDERLDAGDSSPPLQHLAGLIACRIGYGARGVEWLRRAFEAAPDNARFRLIYAQALIDMRRPGEALDILPLPLNPKASDLELIAVRAEAAFKANRRDLESDAWTAFCAVRGDEPLALVNLARSLLAQNRFAEAEPAYRAALALLPTHVPAIHELALTLERTNQIGPLEQLLNAALELGIAKDLLAEPWALLELRLGRPHQAVELLRDAPAGCDDVRWNRLKVRAFDAVGNASAAFAAARAMNAAVPNLEHARSLARQYQGEIRDLCRTVTTNWAEGLPRLGPAPGPRLAFLVGFPRSGTTLADTFLMGHARCQVIEELPLLNSAAATLGSTAHLDEIDPSTLKRVRDAYIQNVQSTVAFDPSHVIVDKFPLNLLAAPLIHCLFSDSPVIFVQRHPCDAVLSGFMQSFEPNVGMASFLDLKDAAMFYDSVMEAWFAMKTALPLNVTTLVYEELVSDPEKALRPVVRALGLDWDESVLDHQATAKRRGSLLNTSYNQVTEQLGRSASGRWHRYREQLEEVLPILTPWARRLGYQD